MNDQPYVTIRSRQPAGGNGTANGESSEPARSGDARPRPATHDISRTSFHMKHIDLFARQLEDSAARAFPNRGRASQRYAKVHALLLHWGSDDLFVLPELEDLEKCLREDYAFDTDIFAIPSENSHLELMMRLGQLVKDHESEDTLFVIYYGGHARIDESRQSTWCATRDPNSPWLQWSAVQTLLERSKSDVLILLDCCAGAASATFPNGTSITETISASSWDAIAPDPGRYSFTNALIEVLQEWGLRTFSAAMLHAEVLARLKHPRPVQINGKHFEARSTPVHFMMTANHKAPSIEISRLRPVEKTPAPLPRGHDPLPPITGRAAEVADPVSSGLAAAEPDEDTPHVMISLALEDDQQLDVHAWEQWLNAFPALAKYVKVQGVFKSHSTLLLVSIPIMIWDLLPEDNAVSFVAFIRSNNLMSYKQEPPPATVRARARQHQHGTTGSDSASFVSRVSGTTLAPTEISSPQNQFAGSRPRPFLEAPGVQPPPPSWMRPELPPRLHQSVLPSCSSSSSRSTGPTIARQAILNQQQSLRQTSFGDNAPEPKKFSAHVESRLEEYYRNEPRPNDAQSALLASNLGIEPWHLALWFHHRRERDAVSNRLAAMHPKDGPRERSNGPQMILPADLGQLLDMSNPGQVLVFDLRCPVHYQRSHIHSAINLRVPRSFLEVASVDMMERSIANEQGQNTFSQWRSASCIVFYARVLEFPWECPPAALILDRFAECGWSGRSFVLKGHYLEFSQSFDKYIASSKMSDAAQAWVDGQAARTRSQSDVKASQELYSRWLLRVDEEARCRPAPTSPALMSERLAAIEAQEKELAEEFEARSSSLYWKAQGIKLSRGDAGNKDDFEAEAGMIEHLDRGLAKMRRDLQAPSTPAAAYAYAPGHTKVPSEGFCDWPRREEDDADGYVEVSRGDDAAAKRTGSAASGETRRPSEEPGRGRGGSGLLSKMFRR